MQIRTWFGGVLLVASITACGSRQRSAQPAPSAPPSAPMAHGHAGQGGGGMCPMMMDPATTQITASDTSDGVALVFTTSGDVAELRARVRHMAEMHNQMAGKHGQMGKGGTQGSGMQGGGMQGMMHMHMVPSRATVEDVPDGARILLVPNDPAQLAALRQHVRMHADMMARGQCPMMASPGPAPAPTPAPGAEHEQHHPGGT